jgi:hypothetical protein
MVRIDGRAAHVALASLVRFAVASRYLSGFARAARPGGCWTPPALGVVADGSTGACRLRFRGPGAVAVRAPHELAPRRRGLELRVDGGRPARARAYELRSGVTVDARVTR